MNVAVPRNQILPASLPPVGISKPQAAALIGISTNLFDQLVNKGLMPDARPIGGRLVWDVQEVTDAFLARRDGHNRGETGGCVKSGTSLCR